MAAGVPSSPANGPENDGMKFVAGPLGPSRYKLNRG
jgi:hypothetical protein